MLAEVLIIWLCLYLLAVHSQLRWLDLVAFCGYKYVGMIASVGCGLLGGTYVYYSVLGYTALTIAYFLVSVRLIYTGSTDIFGVQSYSESKVPVFFSPCYTQ